MIDPAEARRSASAMMRSSITLSLVGVLVGCNDECVDPRTFLTDLHDSHHQLNRTALHLPSGVSKYWAIAMAGG